MSFVIQQMKFVICYCRSVLYDCGQLHKRRGVQPVIVWAQFHKESCNCPREVRDHSVDNTLHLFTSTIKFSFRILACDMYNGKVISSVTWLSKLSFIPWPRPHVSLVSEWRMIRTLSPLICTTCLETHLLIFQRDRCCPATWNWLKWLDKLPRLYIACIRY